LFLSKLKYVKAYHYFVPNEKFPRKYWVGLDEEQDELYEEIEEEIREAPPELVELINRINKKVKDIEEKEGKRGNKVEIEGYVLPSSEYRIFIEEWERMKKAGEIPEDCRPNIGALAVDEDEKIEDLKILYATFPHEVEAKTPSGIYGTKKVKYRGRPYYSQYYP